MNGWNCSSATRYERKRRPRLTASSAEQSAVVRVTDTTDQELKALWAYVDHDKSGRVTVSEFQRVRCCGSGGLTLLSNSLEKIVAIINGAAKRWLHASSWAKVLPTAVQDESGPVGV